MSAEQEKKVTEFQSSYLSDSTIGSSVWQMALGLMLVLCVIFLLAWLMRRVTGIQGSKQHIKILSAINVGTRERAVLVEVAGEQLLLGVASGQVNFLHKIERPVTGQDGTEFSQTLHKAVEKITKQSVASDTKTTKKD